MVTIFTGADLQLRVHNHSTPDFSAPTRSLSVIRGLVREPERLLPSGAKLLGVSEATWNAIAAAPSTAVVSEDHLMNGAVRDVEAFLAFNGVSDSFDGAPGLDESARIVDELRSLKFRYRPPKVQSKFCFFVATDTYDQEHTTELLAAVRSANGSLSVFSGTAESAESLLHDLPSDIGLLGLSKEQNWNEGHLRRILPARRLRRKGSTKAQLRGRGQLSLPLWYWLWSERNGALRHCSWFGKMDSDAFVNFPKLLGHLNELDANEPLYYGTPSIVDFSEYSFAAATNLTYALGGPGYFLSRELLGKVDFVECFKAMSQDPVWLIHDDAGVGYCVSHFNRSAVTFVPQTSVIATTNKLSPWAVVRESIMRLVDDLKSANARGPVGSCLPCLQVVHPLRAEHLILLTTVMNSVVERTPALIADCDHDYSSYPIHCVVVDIAGEQLLVDGFSRAALIASAELRNHQKKTNTFKALRNGMEILGKR